MGVAGTVPSADDVSRQVARIIAMGQGELEGAWGHHRRGKPPAGLPRALLARLLAYRVQAASHGDLLPAHQRFLERVAKDLAAGDRTPNLQLDDPLGLKPGTVLVREHDGEQQRVMLLADGFAWRGQTYKSLSAVAFAITGTRWNGRRFFGLDDASRARGASGAKQAGNVRVPGTSP